MSVQETGAYQLPFDLNGNFEIAEGLEEVENGEVLPKKGILGFGANSNHVEISNFFLNHMRNLNAAYQQSLTELNTTRQTLVQTTGQLNTLKGQTPPQTPPENNNNAAQTNANPQAEGTENNTAPQSIQTQEAPAQESSCCFSWMGHIWSWIYWPVGLALAGLNKVWNAFCYVICCECFSGSCVAEEAQGNNNNANVNDNNPNQNIQVTNNNPTQQEASNQ